MEEPRDGPSVALLTSPADDGAHAIPSPRRAVHAGVVASTIVAVLILGGVLAGAIPSPIQHLVSYKGQAPPGPANSTQFAVVTSANWTARNATVTGITCTACNLRIPVTSTFTFSVALRALCNLFGCAGRLGAVSVLPPFTLVSRDPAPETAFVQNQSTLTLTIQAPRHPGNYSLLGSVEANGMPLTFNVTGVQSTVRYSDASSGTFLKVSPVPPPGLEHPGGVFPLAVSIQNVGTTTVRLDGATVAIPFELVSSSFLPPVDVLSNTILKTVLDVRAPGTGDRGIVNVTLDATVDLDLNYGAVVSIQVSPYYSVAIVPGPSSKNVTPGSTITAYFNVEGGPNASGYTMAFSYLSGGPVTLLSYSPMGYVSLSSAYQLVVSFLAPATAGTFTIVAHFIEK